jgi:hypothetical protein
MLCAKRKRSRSPGKALAIVVYLSVNSLNRQVNSSLYRARDGEV